MFFIDKTIYFKFEIGYVLIDLHQIFSMKPSELKIFISVENFDDKTAEYYRNCYVAKNRIVSKLLKISIPNTNSTNWRLDWSLCQNLTSLSLMFMFNNSQWKKKQWENCTQF